MGDSEIRDEDSDALIASSATPSPLVRTSAVLQCVSGLVLVGCGVQLVTVQFPTLLLAAVPFLMFAFGVVGIVVGASVYRLRLWAAAVGIATSCVAAIGLLAWTVFATMHALLSCMNFVGVPLLASNAIVSLLALRDVRKAASSQKRLADAGIELGL